MRRLPSSITARVIRTAIALSFVVAMTYGQSSPHGTIKQPCKDCHTTESWKELAKPMKFDHATTGFSLKGAHSNAQCLQCHTTKKFAGTSTDCFKCHTSDFAKALLPNHQLGKFSHDCLSCHTMNGWKPSIFQHSKTNFQLVGAHLSVECASCHTNNRFAGLSQDCYGCHQKDFIQTTEPNHKVGQFSHDCLTCHTMAGWTPATFDHNKTNFKLVGAHSGVECSSCHTGGKFKSIPSDCFSCHKQEFNKTTVPNHSAAQFSHDCLTCHTNTAWKPSTFDHNKTNFQLVGSHQTVECSSCHAGGKFKGLTKDCFVCHQKDFSKTTSPNHSAMQLSRNCVECHTNTSWRPSTFDHEKTNFRLIGAHLAIDCASCHSNKQVKTASTDCYTCHQPDYVKTITPNHSQAQFSHDCISCHSNFAWKPSSFDHAKTNFQLVGAHKTAECSSCHTNGQFKGLPTDCYLCHQQDYTKTTTPNHSQGQFSHDCLSCHTSVSWKPSTFDHSKTNFQLVGAHTTAECSSCHINGVFKGLPSDCYSCHQPDYAKTTTPSHSLSQFSHDCLTCHSTVAWKPSTFNHSVTLFPLVGAHVSVGCASCHTNGVFKGLPSDCFSCHQNNFTAVTNPNHVTSQFSHDCLTCHTSTAWKPSTFNHATTSFPLTGAHAAVICSDCHKNGQYKGTSTDCYTCHQADYSSPTLDPNHLASNFDHNCTTCHTTVIWSGAKFDHSKSKFALTGQHTTTPCASCHVGGKYTGTTTDCYICHQSVYSSTKNPDHVAGNYNAARACLSCHNTSLWKPWIFNHDPYYKISKHHNSTVTCAKCHTAPAALTFASCTTGCHTNAHHITQTCYTGSNCHAGSNH